MRRREGCVDGVWMACGERGREGCVDGVWGGKRGGDTVVAGLLWGVFGRDWVGGLVGWMGGWVGGWVVG